MILGVAIVEVGQLAGAVVSIAVAILLVALVRRGVVVRIRDERHDDDDHAG